MGFRIVQRAATAAGVAFALAFLPAASNAQVVVRGVLYDDATGSAVHGTVMLVDPGTDGPVVHEVTDSLGMFSLRASSGTYQIAAVRDGYHSVLSAPVPLADGEQLTIRLPIATTGDPQHKIMVLKHVRPNTGTGARADQPDVQRMDGFYQRRRVGTGLHYTESELAQSGVSTLGEFLERVPGFSVVDPTSASSMNLMRNVGTGVSNGLLGPQSGACRIGWFMDGQRVDIPGTTDPITDGLAGLDLSEIEGLEIFRGISEMPPQFARPDLRCGAVAIWTKH